MVKLGACISKHLYVCIAMNHPSLINSDRPIFVTNHLSLIRSKISMHMAINLFGRFPGKYNGISFMLMNIGFSTMKI